MKQIPCTQLEYEEDGLYYHEGRPFTGVSLTIGKDGGILGQSEFRDGLPWGTVRKWFASGRLALEGHLVAGALHGRRREWFEDGRPKVDEDYELGICLRRNRWDETGNQIEDFHLKPTDNAFQTLQTLRKCNAHAGWVATDSRSSPVADPDSSTP